MAPETDIEEDTPDGWCCPCGYLNDHNLHCDNCGSKPPWGCGCSFCERESCDPDEYEETWDDRIPED